MVVKPDARLSHTNWLTNAVDSEAGMELVRVVDGEVIREKIIASVDGYVETESGQYGYGRINVDPKMVVE